MTELAMEIRAVTETERTIVGVVAPYDETTYRVPGGERIRRNAFARSIHLRGHKIPLYVNHQHDAVMGWSRSFEDGPDGLVGTFAVNAGARGDSFLEDLRNGYMGGLSVCFTTVHAERAADGVTELTEARLEEVSAVGMPAYEGAALLSVRAAVPVEFPPRPEVNLQPIPPLVYRPR